MSAKLRVTRWIYWTRNPVPQFNGTVIGGNAHPLYCDL